MNARIAVAPVFNGSRHDLAAGLWRLADPKISLASFASMFLGACAAASAGFLDPWWLALSVLGIFAIEVAKNASGEIFDFDSGTDLAIAPEDRSPFSGGKRVLVDGLLTREETAWIAAAGYALGAISGVSIALVRAPEILWIGIFGLLLAYEYHAPPLKLSYRGLGEGAVALCYGPGIAAGTFLVQSPVVPATLIVASVSLGLLIAAFLWANEFPDYLADRQAGKKTLVVRLGRERAARVFALLQVISAALVLALPAFGASRWTLLGLAGFVPGSSAALRLLHAPGNTRAIIPAQKEALLAFLLLAAGQGIGFLLGAG